MLFIVYDDFLISNLWWIAAIAVLLVAGIFYLVDFLIKRNKKKRSESPKPEIVASSYLEALGGKENILDKRLDKSRIVLVLKDYSLVKKEELEKIGVTGFILMSDKLTLVIKDKAEEVYQLIFSE